MALTFKIDAIDVPSKMITASFFHSELPKLVRVTNIHMPTNEDGSEVDLSDPDAVIAFLIVYGNRYFAGPKEPEIEIHPLVGFTQEVL